MPYVGRKPSGSLPRIDRSHPFAQGMVAFFVFHEGGGTTVSNLVSGLTGSFVNGPTWVPDRNPNGGYAINMVAASTQYIDLGNDPSLDMNASGSMAVCASYYHPTKPNFTNFVVASKGSQWTLDVEGPSNSGRFYINNGSGGGLFAEGRAVQDGDNRVIGGAWNGATTFGYVAGEGNVASSGTAIFASLPSTATSTKIGLGGGGGGAFNGHINWVAIWNRYVSPEIMSAFQRDPFAFCKPRRRYILVPGGGASSSSIVANFQSASSSHFTASVTSSYPILANFQSSAATHYNATVTAGAANITTNAPTASSQHFLATVSGGATAAGGTIRRGPKSLNWKSLAPVLDWVNPSYKPDIGGSIFPLSDGPVPIDMMSGQRMSIASGSISQVPSSINGIVGNAMSFAVGSGAYFSMPNRFRGPNFITLFVICRPNSTQPADGSRVLSTGGYSLEVRHPNTSNQFNLVKEGGAHVTSGITGAADVWQVFAATYDTGTKNVLFYNYRYDTQVETSTVVNNTVDVAVPPDSTVYIGSAGGGASAFNGELFLAIIDYNCWSIDKIRALAKNPTILASRSRQISVVGAAAAAQTIVTNAPSASSSHFNATVSATSSIVANFQSASSSHFNASVTNSYPILANFQTASSTHFNATVTAGAANINANFQSSGVTHYPATVSGQGSIVANFQSSTATHYGATVTTTTNINANFQSSGATHYPATISAQGAIFANFQSSNETHYLATVIGAQSIIALAQASGVQHYLPTITYLEPVVVVGIFFASDYFAPTYFAPTYFPGIAGQSSADTHDGFLLPIYEKPKKLRKKKKKELAVVEIESSVEESREVQKPVKEEDDTEALLLLQIAEVKEQLEAYKPPEEKVEQAIELPPTIAELFPFLSAFQEFEEIDEAELLAVIEAVEHYEEMYESD